MGVLLNHKSHVEERQASMEAPNTFIFVNAQFLHE